MATAIAECDCTHRLSRIWIAVVTTAQGNSVDTAGVCSAELQSVSFGFFWVSERLRAGLRALDGCVILSATGLAATGLDPEGGSFAVLTDLRLTRRPGEFHMA